MPLASEANKNANRQAPANQKAAENKPLTVGKQLSSMLSGAANAIKKEVTEDIALANETIHHPLGRRRGSSNAKQRAAAANAASSAPAGANGLRKGWSSYSEPPADAYSAETVEGVGNLYQ